ncbi:MAG: helicase-exonuclease AddAB subunit AddB, partial [Lachnospiraceae bacterium]|nr:helicase-exonuclease AddAB subunit AddB [Lachnospiraceae bacterium]
MALRLWLGNAGSGKSHLLYEEVIREAKLHPERNYIFLVPEQYSLQAMRDLVMLHPDGGMINIDILSFNRLSYRVFEEVGFAKAPGLLIDDMGKNLILRHLATAQEGNLKVIGRSLKRLGTITEIKSVISEFMQYGVDEKAIGLLQEKCRQNNRRLLSEKLDDIACLYSAFRNYISEKYTTTEELLSTVSGILPDSKKLADSVIVLDGFTGFTPVQYNLIQALLKHCIDVHVSVLLDTNAGTGLPAEEQELFYLSGKTIRECRHLAQSAGVEVLPDMVIRDEIPRRFAAKKPPMLIHLEKNLFRENAQTGGPEEVMPGTKGEWAGDIQILTAANPLDEMSYVALKIRELVRDHGYRYKDIAVVSADPETYMYAARRAFTRHEIPFFVDKKQPVLQNPFIEYLRSIMRILTENGSHEAVFSYLRSSMLPIGAEDIDLLENYCLACGIRTKKQWMNRFLKRPSFVSEEDLQKLDRLREEIISPFSIFDTAGTVRDYCICLYRMMTLVNAQQQIEERRKAFAARGEDVRAKEYDLIYPAVIRLLEKL